MVVLGIDESYKQIGVSVVRGNEIASGEILRVKSYNYKGLKSKTSKRRFVKKLVRHAIEKYNPEVIIVERIRTFSQRFISTNYIKATGALIATIVDAAYPLKVYSADTRSWKSKVCGSSKGIKNGDKQVSVNFVKRRFGLELDDDAADSLCIALYGLNYKNFIQQKLLKIEE